MLTAIFTGFIAWFTWTLRQSTEKMWIETKKAADAAMLNAKAAVAIELPIIKASPDKLGKGAVLKQGIQTEHISVNFVAFSNVGRTKAFPVELRYGFAIGTLPEEPEYAFSETFPFNDIFDADPKNENRKFLTETNEIESGIWSRVCAGSIPIWFYCELSYLDFMQDDPREAAFCWRWQNVGMGMGWRPDDTAAYNR